jgi:Icc-related predicted phosphoesterase
VKIVAVSDLHGTLPEIPPCDLLLVCGDICPLEDHSVGHQGKWLDTTFRHWLMGVPARKVIGVAGNHDWVFQTAASQVPRGLAWTYLEDSGCEWERLHFWGSPWQPQFCNWAFNLDEAGLARKWAQIPPGTDVLVLHGPPFGYGDTVVRRDGVVQTGSPSLVVRIDEVRPRLVVFGHIHEGRGQWRRGRSVLANVTVMDEFYRPVHRPWEHDLEP